MSRSLLGPFGQRGKLRLVTACWAASAVMSLFPALGINSHAESISIFGMLPLLLGSTISLFFIMTFSGNQELAMLPWIDMANHKSGESAKFEYNLWSDCVEWKSCSSNDDAWITYDYGGESGVTNDKLLATYGFVEVNNPNDTLILKVNDDVDVILGRYGKVVATRPTGEDSEVSSALVEAASQARNQLLAPVLTPPDQSDKVDVGRADLAATWRREKVRLLDEFLSRTLW